MSGENVLNRFEQTPGALGANDNKFVMGGTVEQEAGSTISLGGAVESAGGADLKTKLITVEIPDISTASSVWVVPGFACTVVAISTVINGAIITADAVLDPQIGGVSITGGGITIAFTGSAAGVVDQATPSAANAVAANEAVEIATDGGSTNTVAAVVTIEVLPD